MRYRRFWVAAAAVAVATLLTLGPPARATFEIDYSTDNGATITQLISSSTNAVNYTGAAGTYNVILSAATDNVPGTPANANVRVFNSTVTGSGNGLILYFSADGFTNPHSPPADVLSTSSSGTNMAVSQLDYAGYVGSTLASVPGGGYQSIATAGPGTYSPLTNGGAGSGPSIYTTFNAPSNYVLTQAVSFGAGNINVGTITAEADVTPTPAPASLTLLFSGLPLLGLGRFWLRRRQGPLATA